MKQKSNKTFSREKRDFCDINAISIKKFLRDNYDSIGNFKTNNKNRKWRIKHREILSFAHFVEIPIDFAYRYKELVCVGKILIVRDDYGFFKAYLNPQLFAESCALENFEMLLSEFLQNALEEDLEDDFTRKNLIYQIGDLQENVRLIHLFHGDEALKQTQSLYATSEEERNQELKRVEPKRNL